MSFVRKTLLLVICLARLKSDERFGNEYSRAFNLLSAFCPMFNTLEYYNEIEIQKSGSTIVCYETDEFLMSFS